MQTSNKLADRSIGERSKKEYEYALLRYEAQFGDWRTSNDEEIAEAMSQLFHKGLSTSTINTFLAAIKYQAKTENVPVPIGDITRRTLAGISRSPRMPKLGQAKPLTWEQSEFIADKCVKDGITGLRDACLIMVGSDALLRKSEMAAVNIEDIDFDTEGGLLNIRKSKTDQKGRGQVMYLGDKTADFLKQWIAAAGIKEGAIFRPIYRKKVIDRRLSTRQLVRIITKRAHQSGIDGIRGHSLRVGGAVSLASLGASLVEMQAAGNWKSPAMPAHYAAGESAKRGPVARYRYKKG